MSMSSRAFVAFLAVSAASLGNVAAEERPPHAGSAHASALPPVGTVDLGPAALGRGKTGWVWVDPIADLAPDAVETNHISNLIFINRCEGGCTIQPGNNDARYNTSSIAQETTRLISEFAYSDEIWDATIACIRDVYAPYNVEIVTEDPGDEIFHHEAILAGTASEMGLDSLVGGIAPANCDPLNNVISFSFANTTRGDVETMCWTVAQESAHAFGLPNHVFNCHDPMTYIPGCERKYFRNKYYPCGENEAKPCNCTGQTQNSHLELRTVFGDGEAPPPPTVTLLAPEADAQVTSDFAVYVEATDSRHVDRLELYINGSLVGERTAYDLESITGGSASNQYNFTAPEWPDGYLNLEVVAYNDLGSASSATVRVLKGEPCTDDSACFAGQECSEGGCAYPPATAALGDECEIDQECLEGACKSHGGDTMCALACNPSVSGSCSEGFTCVPEGACWPDNVDAGCCTVAGDGADDNLPWLALGLFGLGVAALRRRRA